MPKPTKKNPAISDTEIKYLSIKGAKTHNLKNIDLQIPRNQLVTITGLSGSGKSSLAFDTIYAEGQRRYMETFSSYARQFLGGMERPDVESIEGLSPVIAIEQKTTGRNPRSTVGTITEIYDFLRLLYARIGEAYSYNTGKKMVRFSETQILEYIFEHFENQKIVILAPMVRGRKGHYRELFEQIQKQGYVKVRIDGELHDIVPQMQVDRYKIHDIEVVIDRLQVSTEFKQRLAESISIALKIGEGLLMVLKHNTADSQIFSKNLMCVETGISYAEPSPNSFSFNSPYGACPHCKGIGQIHDISLKLVIPNNTKTINEGGIAAIGEPRTNYTFDLLAILGKDLGFDFNTPLNEISEEAMQVILYGTDKAIEVQTRNNSHTSTYKIKFEGVVNMLKRFYEDANTSDSIRRWAEEYMEYKLCTVCEGNRLKKESLHFKIAEKNISELNNLDLNALYNWFCKIENPKNELLSEKQELIGKEIIKELKVRLLFLLEVGLNYLSLNRPAGTLSGGEAQRIRLATQIGSQLVGITYILDEPSIGLHQRDNQKLIQSLKQLALLGNSVLVVEHDKDIMLAADYLIDLGPLAGKHGGEIVAQGTPAQILKQTETLTCQYLTGVVNIEVPKNRRTGNGNFLVLEGANGNNLKNVTLQLPLGKFICVTGVSGSGKSTLINETLHPILSQHFYRSVQKPLEYKAIHGIQYLDKVIEIDQSPIGRTPRSNPATYTGVFTNIRDIFATLPESKIRGYKTGRFSFNVKGGRCETCEGGGMKVIEMNFLPDVYVPCETCLGKRYNRETLQVRYKGKSISDVLDMTIEEAVPFFQQLPRIHRQINTLLEVGLGYLTLGQQATTLSGGEAQRVKLASELSKKDTGKTLYILDEPTTGLHFEDIRLLLQILNKLADRGNTVIVIEHNLDVIKVADHIIDIGLEGGNGGGTIVAEGTPEAVAQHPQSHTAAFLKSYL